MKHALAIAMSASLIFAGQSPVQGSEGHTVVATRSSETVWVQRLTRELSDNIRFPVAIGRAAPATGFVTVRFECGQDGKPTNLVVMHRADRRLDVQAVRAVSSLRTLHPLPDGVEPGRQMQANIIFADSQDELERQIRLVQRAEAERLAASPVERSVLAFGMSSRGPG